MSQKKIGKANNFFTCENYLPFCDTDVLTKFLEIAYKLKINLLIIDDLSIKKRDAYLEALNLKEIPPISSQMIYERFKDTAFTSEKLKDSFKNFLYSGDCPRSILATRKTIRENSIEKIKKQLGSVRSQYEIISLLSSDRNTLKWAAQDRRIDYITIEILENSACIDQSLCSVVKQNNKSLEIVLSPILKAKNDRELSDVLRKGKKVMRLINSTNTPFVYTMKPESPLELRTNSQMRLLGGLLDIPYNQSKNYVFETQLKILITNTMKLHDSHIFEGVREV
jgi:RNase P/RNase MRP subunit p30